MTQTFTIPILSDSVDENNETFVVTLSSPSNAGLSSSTATMTITDDDAAPTVSLGDLTSAEVAGTVNLVATLSAAQKSQLQLITQLQMGLLRLVLTIHQVQAL